MMARNCTLGGFPMTLRNLPSSLSMETPGMLPIGLPSMNFSRARRPTFWRWSIEGTGEAKGSRAGGAAIVIADEANKNQVTTKAKNQKLMVPSVNRWEPRWLLIWQLTMKLAAWS